MTEQLFISLIVPAYNEADRLEVNLNKIHRFLQSTGWTFEIVPVDDGSTDGTSDVLEKLARQKPDIKPVGYPLNAGKGRAIQCGIAVSKGKWVVTLDADLELPVAQIQTFLRVQRETRAHVVIGSKWHPDSKVVYPVVRQRLSRGLHTMIRLLFPLSATDTQVGIKLMDGDAARLIGHVTLVKRFAWDIEFLLVAYECGLRFAEAPVDLKFLREGPGRVNLKTVLQITREVAGIWYRYYIRGFYKRSLLDWSRGQGPPLTFQASLQRDLS